MIRFRALKNVGPRTFEQFKKLNNGCAGVMFLYLKPEFFMNTRTYVSYMKWNGNVIGWSCLTECCPDWEIPLVNVYVGQTWRGQGIATSLIRNILSNGTKYMPDDKPIGACRSLFRRYEDIMLELDNTNISMID